MSLSDMKYEDTEATTNIHPNIARSLTLREKYFPHAIRFFFLWINQLVDVGFLNKKNKKQQQKYSTSIFI
jgi:hypothetical protein